MKFSISKELLLQAVQDVTKAVATKSTIPILENIKIDVHNDTLQMTGTNMEVGIEYTITREQDNKINFTVEQTGSICLKARYFQELIRKLSHDTVEIEVTNNYLTNIKCGNSEFNIHGLDSDEFPKLPNIIKDKVFTISSDLLRSIIRQTVFAVSLEETRPVLTGVKWSLENGILSFISTDSHRLAMREVAVEVDQTLSFQNVIVPGKSLIELGKILEENDSSVDVFVTNNQIFVKTSNILFYSSLLEGQYPDVTRILQQQPKIRLEINRKEFSDSLERASLIARENKNNEVKLNIKESTVVISSNSPDIGKVNEVLNAISIDGEDLLIAFNAKYVLDVLRVIDESEIEIQFTGSMSPFIIKPKNFDKYMYLVLPIRIYQG